MSHSLSILVDSRVAQGWVVGWYHTGWEAIDISFGEAPPMMVILWISRCTRSAELIDLYDSHVRGYGHSYDLCFIWLVRGVLSTFPWVMVLDSAFGRWGKVRVGVGLAARESEMSWDVCIGWENVWMRWGKTWWTIIIKYWWTCIGNV
jgi:hypothetical protein